ncbi:MAG: hypothetical protein ACR2RF_19805 [Geminicoccaceae bacterium]
MVYTIGIDHRAAHLLVLMCRCRLCYANCQTADEQCRSEDAEALGGRTISIAERHAVGPLLSLLAKYGRKLDAMP